MNKQIALVAMSLLVLAQVPASFAQDTSRDMPPQVSVAGKSLKLNGVGIREATVLKLDVYNAGLYLTQKSSDPQQILSSRQPKAVRMHFLRDVRPDQMRDAWNESFERNCGDRCSTLREPFKRFQSRMAGAQEGDIFAYLFLPDGLTVLKNGKQLVQIQDPAFSQLILSTWLGDHPPSQDLRAGMLGLERKVG